MSREMLEALLPTAIINNNIEAVKLVLEGGIKPPSINKVFRVINDSQ